MRQKLLLFVMMVSFGALYAQTDTIRSVVISEARWDRADHAYLELTNMGAEAVNLAEFELLSHTPWNAFPDGALWPTEPHRIDNRWLMLPDQILGPGESYVVSVFHDWGEEQYALDVAKFGYSEDHSSHVTKPEFKKLTDLPVHRGESPNNDPTDSISVYDQLLESWGGGRDVIYLRHHPAGADSAVVDQVGGVFTDADGTNPSRGYHNVAGFPEATGRSVLVRRFDVKQGNLTFVRGNDLSESEWIPIPFLRESNDTYEANRAVFWTVGNHGDYNLDEATLTSSTIDIDWTNHVLTVPYGVRNDDSIMYQFDRVPGLGWHYHYNTGETSPEDSASVGVRTGDSLSIYAVGNDLDLIKWHIEAAPPTADANWVIPLKKRNDDNEWPETDAVWAVSHMVPGMDTISGVPYATRVDSLLKYLDKPEKANWAMVWVDGMERADLLDGDKLKVTAEDGSDKEYYVKVQKYRADRNAYLSAITWPDIPEDYKGIFGWVGDTIPEYVRSKYDYKVTVPWDVDGIPALVAKNEDDNARHVVKRATNLAGGVEDRTVTFTSTAENDTSILTYNVLLEKEKDLDNVQPWVGEPFISQFTWKTEYSHTLVEIVNPGTEVLDLSDYMFFCGYENDPPNAIAGWEDWADRYVKYIPGYKWQDEADWTVQRHIAVQDLNVKTNIWPGDVFVMAEYNVSTQGTYVPYEEYTYRDQIDIEFRNNPWGEEYTGGTPVYQWKGMNFIMWKIKNDSVKQGLKPATDPADFELIEVFGMGDGTDFAPLGTPSGQVSSYTRKPNIYKANAEFQGSFGADADSSEWLFTDEDVLNTKGYGWPDRRILVPEGTGSHFMNEVTVYRSTVASLAYKVTPGFTMEEEIRGVVTATTVEDLAGNLIPADTGQRMKVIAVADGAELDLADAVMNGDTLVVTSADSSNVSKYILEVTDDGLSDDAVLTSTDYTVDATGTPPSVSGFDYGTTLKAVADGMMVPAGATMTVVDAMDAYVPFQRLNFDTVYMDVLVSDQIFFDVVAEDGVTAIKYQLMPNSDPTDAFVTSDVYGVDQISLLISLVPTGINVDAFMAKLVPAPGATLQLFDKLGLERNDGIVSMDDRLQVTSANGEVVISYYLSVLNEEPNYLAYVLSDVYLVDQDALTITGVMGSESVTVFSGNVTPAEGATMEVQNTGGAAKGDADMMEEADMLQVTASNGVTVTTYVITLDVTGFENLSEDGVNIYPNPSTGLVNISGAEAGSRIRVYNSVGVNVSDIIVYSGIETISLEDQPAGMFFITISNSDEITGHYKVIKN